jgi:Tfp pilus assembly PilM family ATPase
LSSINNKSLGISFSSDKIHFTELLREGSNVKLNFFDTISLDIDFEEELWKYKSNQKILTNVSNEIQKVLNKRGTNFSNISLTISSSQAFMLILPVDLTDSKSTLNTKIYWELSNYFPDNYKDFVVNTYRLNSFMPVSNCDEVLIIAVLNNTLEFVKRVSKLCNVKLNLIDIDHFSAEFALRKNYLNQVSNSNILLVGLKNGRFDFGYIVKGKYKHFSYSKYYSEPEYNLTMVKKLKSFMQSSVAANGVDTIFLYGDEIKESLINSIKKLELFNKIEIINPFSSISASNEYLQDDELRKSHFIYTSSCGVALRNI